MIVDLTYHDKVRTMVGIKSIEDGIFYTIDKNNNSTEHTVSPREALYLMGFPCLVYVDPIDTGVKLVVSRGTSYRTVLPEVKEPISFIKDPGPMFLEKELELFAIGSVSGIKIIGERYTLNGAPLSIELILTDEEGMESTLQYTVDTNSEIKGNFISFLFPESFVCVSAVCRLYSNEAFKIKSMALIYKSTGVL